jgi:hypothetical protein
VGRDLSQTSDMSDADPVMPINDSILVADAQ